jgi:hypothetical protein
MKISPVIGLFVLVRCCQHGYSTDYRLLIHNNFSRQSYRIILRFGADRTIREREFGGKVIISEEKSEMENYNGVI